MTFFRYQGRIQTQIPPEKYFDEFQKSYERSGKLYPMFKALEQHAFEMKNELFDFHSDLALFAQSKDILNDINLPEFKEFPTNFDMKQTSTEPHYKDQVLKFTSPISSISTSWDGNSVVLGSFATIYNLKAEEIPTMTEATGIKLVGNNSYVRKSAFHPSDALLAITGPCGSISLIDIKSNQAVANIAAHKNIITSLDFTSDGSKLLSSSRDGIINVTDLIKSKVLREIKVRENISCVSVSKYDDYVVTGTENGSIYIFDNRSKDIMQTLDAHYTPVSAIATNHEGIIASGGIDKACRIWDIRGIVMCVAHITRNSSPICTLEISDNDKLFIGTDNGHLNEYELNTALHIEELNFSSRPIAMKFVPKINSLLVSTDDLSLHVCNPENIEIDEV